MKKTFTITPAVKTFMFVVKYLWVDKVTGLNNLPKKGAFIIAPNHSSYIEHIIISCIIIPHRLKEIYFVAKKEHFESLTQKSWHESWDKYVKYIHIDRNQGEKALKETLACLKKDEAIVIYPEGTRTLTGKIQKGKTGVARLALGAKVPVVPLGIIGTFKILPKGKRIPKLKKAQLHFGKPMYFSKYYNNKLTKELLRKVTNEIMRKIAKLSNQKYNF